MANIKVSELNSATSLNDEDLLMIVQNNENKKISIDYTQIAKSIEMSFTTIAEYQTYCINTAPVGTTLYWLNINGRIIGSVLEKASSSYLSFILFSYEIILTQYRYSNGDWYINNLKGGLTSLLNYEVNTKEEITLNDNVNNYDLIIVLATANAYNHRRITNIYLPTELVSTRVQWLQYSPTDWDANLTIYDNILDTTSCENIGTDNRRIISAYGVKL